MAPQPYFAPRHFHKAEHNRPDDKTLSMSQTEVPFLPYPVSGHVFHEDSNKLASPSQAVSDLPSWTPLMTPEDDESSASDREANELPTSKKITNPATKRLGRLPTNSQATVKNVMTAGQTPKLSSDITPYKAKKTRFYGVLITTKPPPLDRKHRSQKIQSKPAHAAPNKRALSLVDALARTFDANKHTEYPFLRPSRTSPRQRDDTSRVPQTDVETTEAEDDQLRLNTRLTRAPLRRRHRDARGGTTTVSEQASESSSEDVTSFLQDIPQQERPVKRLRPIQYESSSALIDAALGTVEAPISWSIELGSVRDEDFDSPAQTAHVPVAGNQVTVGEGDHTIGSPGKGSVSPPILVGDEWHMPTRGNPKGPVLTPYLARGAMFRQRLDAIFGENATVRTDRVARPRPVDPDYFAPYDEPDKQQTTNTNGSTASIRSASTAEEGASAVPSTHITSQSPDALSVDTGMGQSPHIRLDGTDTLTNPTPDADDDQMSGWVTALQRLVKGKVHVREQDLETLSIILAEIDSVKDSLNENVPMTSALRESVKQLSELQEIPFGDRNMLRERAENIFRTWTSIKGPGAP